MVLDRKMFQEENHELWVGRESRVATTKPEDYSSEEKMLMPAYTYGYSLASKVWAQFYVDNIHDTEWDRDAFDSLILADNQKRVLRSLVMSHKYPSNARDETQQKGKGLVVLLHGTPGSGKTLTAGEMPPAIVRLDLHVLNDFRIICRNQRQGPHFDHARRAEQVQLRLGVRVPHQEAPAYRYGLEGYCSP